MQRIILSLTIALVTLSANAQKIKESEVPVPVKVAFKKAYPKVKDIDWEKGDKNYEAEFKTGEREESVLMDKNGNILETETEVAVSELPANVQDYVSKHYKEAKIKEVSRIIDSKGSVMYEVEIKGKDLMFDGQGSFLKEVVK